MTKKSACQVTGNFKVTIEMTAEQAYTLMEALEFFSRIHMGQFDVLEYNLQMDKYDTRIKRPEYDRKLAQAYLDSAKHIIFGGIQPGAYMGIADTNKRSRTSWDIYQQLRHDTTVYRLPDEPRENRGNAYDKVQPISDEPLPKVTITGE
jgi:hypothetical protein